MFKNIISYGFFVCALSGVFLNTAFAQETKIIKGTVEQIAEDGSYFVVKGEKLLATKDFLDEALLEIGDDVEITAEVTKEGLKATNYNYIFEEEEPIVSGEPAKATEPAKVSEPVKAGGTEKTAKPVGK